MPGARRFESRMVQDGSGIKAVQELASRLWPPSWHPGGLGWALARGRLADEVILFDGQNGPVAWLAQGIHQPGGALALADPKVAGAAEAVAAWLRNTATRPRHTVQVSDGEPVILPALRSVGFQVLPGQPVVGMHLPASGAAVVDIEGYDVRPVGPGETSARVEAHRAAWRPPRWPMPLSTEPRWIRVPRALSPWRPIKRSDTLGCTTLTSTSWWKRPMGSWSPVASPGSIPQAAWPRSSHSASFPNTGSWSRGRPVPRCRCPPGRPGRQRGVHQHWSSPGVPGGRSGLHQGRL